MFESEDYWPWGNFGSEFMRMKRKKLGSSNRCGFEPAAKIRAIECLGSLKDSNELQYQLENLLRTFKESRCIKYQEEFPAKYTWKPVADYINLTTCHEEFLWEK